MTEKFEMLSNGRQGYYYLHVANAEAADILTIAGARTYIVTRLTACVSVVNASLICVPMYKR